MSQQTIRILALTAAVLTVASTASAYVLLSPPRTWDCAPDIIVDDRGNPTISDPDHGVTATANAIESPLAWNGAVTGLLLSATPGSVAGFSLGDGIPMLNFQDPFNACTGNCLAATFTGFYDQRPDGSWRIFDADIVTSDNFDWTTLAEPDGCSSEFFMEGVQVHEVGHVMGLGHTSVTGATMFPSVSSCNNGPATIEADDAAAIVALYGAAGLSCSGNPGGGGGGGGGSCAPQGARCDGNADCCSDKCRGRRGAQTCR